MKKLYRKGTVHPSPPIVSDHLAFLPVTILTLAAALSAEDREVLAYLISCSNNSYVNLSSTSSYGPRNNKTTAAAKKAAAKRSGKGGFSADHAARFNCNCFRCYTSYWVRWDESPNRQLIHEIIDAFEDGVLAEGKGHSNSKSNNSRKEKRNKKSNSGSGELKRSELSLKKEELAQAHIKADQETGGGTNSSGGGKVDEEDSGSVRRFVSFLGEKIWGVWS